MDAGTVWSPDLSVTHVNFFCWLRLKTKIENLFFFSFCREIRLPERTCPVGTSEGHDDSATKTAASAEHKSSTKVENVASEGTLFAVPDLTSVLYTESYDEFIATKELVIPESQCWGSQQSVYIGCKGGQVLMVDSESGLVTVLANPQIIKVWPSRLGHLCTYNRRIIKFLMHMRRKMSLGRRRPLRDRRLDMLYWGRAAPRWWV